jgi:hypothetical protein
LAGIEVVALEPLAVGVDDALGGVDHALAAGIVARPGDQGATASIASFAVGRLRLQDRSSDPIRVRSRMASMSGAVLPG